ncbi:MAG: hypothetical protein KIT11_09120 [Fimbriimonadaceae bacterium]|nr:hypothetical protein [Fimbriimonadaceae bacterium]QYK55488.1 MAG: hypothetical protein KF733_10790 [Fimbriimonadaceae bacterium]
MRNLRLRVGHFIATYGEAFTVFGVAHTGLFSTATSSQARNYASNGELDLPPYVICMVPHTDTTAEGDPVVWNGRTFNTSRVIETRYQGSVIAKLLFFGLTFAEPSPSDSS